MTPQKGSREATASCDPAPGVSAEQLTSTDAKPGIELAGLILDRAFPTP